MCQMTEIHLTQYLPDKGQVPPINTREVWRYAGYLGLPSEEDKALRDIYDHAVSAAGKALTYKVCWRKADLTFDEDGMPRLPFPSRSKGVAKLLQGSCQAVMFAATVGMAYDRLIQRTQRVNVAEALILQALGAERVESLCDRFCEQFRESLAPQGLTITPRYSPGYGDLPLDTQRDFLRLLEMDKRIGISLGETLLMTPSKSVTALFGIRPAEGAPPEPSKCAGCTKQDCEYRKTLKEPIV